MKTTSIKSLFLAVVAVLAFSLNVHAGGKKPINIKKSTIKWVGKKVTGEHAGTINFKKGNVIVKGHDVIGGEFVVDMTTISVTDLSGKGKEKLEGHLKADDFFGVEKFPEASFKITEVEGTTVKGDLTIKGHTEKLAFVLEIKDNTISGLVKIDRTKFDIRYGSKSFFNVGNKAIDDEFELTIHIEF